MAVKIFFGNDIKQLRKILEREEEKLVQQSPELELYVPDNPSLPVLMDKLSSGSLFAGKELVKIYDFDKIAGIEKLAAYLNDAHDIFLISYKDKIPAKLSKIFQAEIFDCKLPESYQLEKILQKEFSAQATPEVIRYLSQSLSSLVDIDELKEEMQKKNIQQLDMQKLYGLVGDLQAQVFLIVDDILEKKTKTAIMQVNQYLDAGGKLPGLLINLGSQLNKLSGLKEALPGKSDQDLAAILGINPKIVWKYKKMAGNHKQQVLSEAQRLLPQLELKTRMHQNMQRYFMEKFILELASGELISL
ncbi:MAG: hypothetical protein CVV50_00885 [Spirochaetae bacterium HGW-Spirochaetae-6]|nr:MAG: hypothetical protein CVV50_00885 [Spirochaetae bacterium HGW-Spirochaetae-6]